MPFQQRTNTSCYLGEIPTHGFTVVLSVFGGTPPAKPLNCKIRFVLSGGAMNRSWAHHVGDQPMLVLAKSNLSPEDITWMSLCSCSQIVHLSLLFVHRQQFLQRENKNPAYVSVSRVRESFFDLQNLLTPSLSKLPSGSCPIGRDSPMLNAQPGLYRL